MDSIDAACVYIPEASIQTRSTRAYIESRTWPRYTMPLSKEPMPLRMIALTMRASTTRLHLMQRPTSTVKLYQREYETRVARALMVVVRIVSMSFQRWHMPSALMCGCLST